MKVEKIDHFSFPAYTFCCSTMDEQACYRQLNFLIFKSPTKRLASWMNSSGNKLIALTLLVCVLVCACQKRKELSLSFDRFLCLSIQASTQLSIVNLLPLFHLYKTLPLSASFSLFFISDHPLTWVSLSALFKLYKLCKLWNELYPILPSG